MTEATDAKPEPGWYVVTTSDGRLDCQWRDSAEVFTPGWRAISIADLLRNAARYRWLLERNHHRPEWLRQISGLSADTVAAIIDAEMARDRKPEGGE